MKNIIQHNQKRKFFCFFVSFISLIFVSVSGAEEKRFALVIGNADYKNASRLTQSLNDAEDMKSALDKLGFQTKCLKNVKRREIEDAVRDFREQLKQNTDNVALLSGLIFQFYYN